MTADAILPGAAVGVLGSGQLGRMFAIAARRMGYRVHVLSPEYDTPTGQVADEETTASYDDLDAVRAFARRVRVVTFEFENVPAATAAAAAECVPVRPSGPVLHTTQNRMREKQFLVSHGLPVTPFALVHGPQDFDAAVASVGTPAVLKTASFGYDGKGQTLVRTPADLASAWVSLGQQPSVLEAFIEFERELSVVAGRALDGSFADFGAVENRHVRHILDVTIAPAPIDPRIASEAVDIARAVLDALGVVGVLCVEFFLTSMGRLLINELAPRPHNSGHFTFDASVTSQFEQQLRAVCGLPLGSTRQLAPAAMANLLGDLWADGEPDFAAAAAFSNVKLHVYGKAMPRPGRKLGHLTALAQTTEEATRLVLAARASMSRAARPLAARDERAASQRERRGARAAGRDD
jgi:5-(carboxyamino)imidazole ribonucleotide synthase